MKKYLTKGRELLVGLAMLTFLTLALGMNVSAAKKAVAIPEVTVDNSKNVSRTYTYTNKDKLTGSDRGVIVPLVIKNPGQMLITPYVMSLGADSVKLSLYQNEKCSGKAWKTLQSKGSTSVMIEEAGTYYLKIYSTYTKTFTNKVKIKAKVFTTGDKELTVGKAEISYLVKDEEVYYKFTTKRTGYITIIVDKFTEDSAACSVQMLTTGKKARSDTYQLSSGGTKKAYVAVQAKKTYLLKVVGDGHVTSVRVTNTKVVEDSGDSKDSAVSVEVSKRVLGIIEPKASTKGDWYKLEITDPKVLRLTLSGKTNGSVRIYLYNEAGSDLTNGGVVLGQYKDINGKTQIKTKTTLSSAPSTLKGTYYVKVVRASSLGSAYYSLQYTLKDK